MSTSLEGFPPQVWLCDRCQAFVELDSPLAKHFLVLHGRCYQEGWSVVGPRVAFRSGERTRQKDLCSGLEALGLSLREPEELQPVFKAEEKEMSENGHRCCAPSGPMALGALGAE
jgi:hypothetical protein